MAFFSLDAQLHKEVSPGMLEEMPAPCHIAIDEDFESSKGSSDSRHMIPLFMKKCEDMAIMCEDRANVCFSMWNLFCFILI